MNVAWAMFWGGSRSTKLCVFPSKVAAGGEERYLVCATGASGVVSYANCSSSPMCFATSGCSCVRSSMRFLKLWLQIALEWLHECCMLFFGEEAGARNLVFFRVKWLQATTKGTSCVRQVRLGSFQRELFLLCVLQRVVVPVCVVPCGS